MLPLPVAARKKQAMLVSVNIERRLQSVRTTVAQPATRMVTASGSASSAVGQAVNAEVGAPQL